MITQSLLAEFKALQDEVLEKTNRAMVLREQILAAHGVDPDGFEPGPLHAVINTFPRKSISWAVLEQLLGPVAVAELKQKVEPKTVTTLKVEPA